MGARIQGVYQVDDLSLEELQALAAIGLSLTHRELIPISGLVNDSGNNLILTPSSGKKLKIAYLSYNPNASVECYFRLGEAGVAFLRTNVLVAGTVIAKDFGDFRYIEGDADESLYLNLSSAIDTIWNAFYSEV